MSSPQIALVAGGCVGVFLYSFSRVFRKQSFSVEHLFEAAMCGCLMMAGVSLIYCAVQPSTLVHYVAENGNPASSQGNVQLTDIGVIEFLMGGAAALFMALNALLNLCGRTDSKDREPAQLNDSPVTRLLGRRTYFWPILGAFTAFVSAFGLAGYSSGLLSISWEFWSALACLAVGILFITLKIEPSAPATTPKRKL